MPEIKDTGKVWVRGAARPIFAIRVDDKYFAPGKNDDQTIEYWIEGNYLCVDLHNAEKKVRVGRRIKLNEAPTTPATLFSGFERTRHADVMSVTDRGAETFVVEGMEYDVKKIAALDSRSFWLLGFAPPAVSESVDDS
ncbi:MAG: hypothetical protein ACE5GQ_10700 [Nitrospinales bacterium]